MSQPITQVELIGIEHTCYLLWNSGERAPTSATPARLVELLEVEPHDLVDLDVDATICRNRGQSVLRDAEVHHDGEVVARTAVVGAGLVEGLVAVDEAVDHAQVC